MWFKKKKKTKAPIINNIKDINDYIIKHYVPTTEELKPKRFVRKQTIDHVVAQTRESYSFSGEIKFSISDERENDGIQYMLDLNSLDDLENLPSKQASKKLDNITKESFSSALMDCIIQKDIKNSLVYKSAQIDRKLFSKIISVKGYNPSKDTAIALAIALKLDLQETNILLSKAGYVLSGSRKKDLIIAYFINKKTYDIDAINDALYKLGERTLGRY